jgi:hypothetical protein
MKTFSDKTRSMMLVASNGYCQIKNCYNKVTEFHHIVANTEVNQRLYPLYLQSPFNCFAICNDCHMTKPLPVRPPEHAVACYEEYLQDLKKGK